MNGAGAKDRRAPSRSVIVALLWLYFSARVLLFGGEIVAVRQKSETQSETMTGA